MLDDSKINVCAFTWIEDWPFRHATHTEKITRMRRADEKHEWHCNRQHPEQPQSYNHFNFQRAMITLQYSET